MVTAGAGPPRQFGVAVPDSPVPARLAPPPAEAAPRRRRRPRGRPPRGPSPPVPAPRSTRTWAPAPVVVVVRRERNGTHLVGPPPRGRRCSPSRGTPRSRRRRRRRRHSRVNMLGRHASRTLASISDRRNTSERSPRRRGEWPNHFAEWTVRKASTSPRTASARGNVLDIVHPALRREAPSTSAAGPNQVP